jgi:hypothetical protein
LAHNQRKQFADPARFMDLDALSLRGTLIETKDWANLSQFQDIKTREMTADVQSAMAQRRKIQELLFKTTRPNF